MAFDFHLLGRLLRPEQGYQISIAENDRYRRYLTSFVCSFLSIFYFIVMAAIDVFQHYYMLTAILLACAVICIICVLMQVSTYNYHLPSLLLCSTHIILTWFLFTIGANHFWSLMWTFAYPHAFMLWLGLAEGAAMGLFFIASMFLLSLPPIRGMLPNQYDWPSLLRYLIVLCALFILAFFIEFIRDRMQKKLTLLTQQAKNMAFTDPLTGLGNRLAFEQHLQSEYARFMRTHGKFCLIMGDIDRFKQINDNKGHAVGDAVLQHTAELMQGRLRRQDGIYRWGGEEFVITLHGLTIKDVARIAEELRYAIAESPCPYQNEKVPYTMSFGVYCCTQNDTPEQAMRRVDELLYAAKRAGRNRIMTDVTLD